MKKLLFPLMMLLLLCSVSVCQAQMKLEVNKSGEYRAKSAPNEYAESSISADSAAMEYVVHFLEAVAKPMSLISVDTTEEIKKMITPLKALKEIKKIIIVYDSSTKTIVLSETRTLEEGTSFALVFGLMSVFSMVLFQIFNKRKRRTYPYFLIITLLILIFFLPDLVPALSLLAMFIALIALLVVFIILAVFDGAINKTCRIMIKLYYVAMVAYFVFMFLGI